MYNESNQSSTYNPVENGKWKGSMETSIENIEREIIEIKQTLNNIQQNLNNIEKEVEVLKYKSSIWGFLAGLLPALGALIYFVLKK